ncbi:MAG: curli-like amyloid fiber formation chaperone CsgH [Pseudomonadota bacterium]
MQKLSHRLLILAGLTVFPIAEASRDMTSIAMAAARVGCEIRASRNNDAAKLEAIVKASGPVAGSYTLDVRKGSGGAVVSKSGDFKVDSTTPSEVKAVSLDLEPGESYDASLSIKWPNGSSSCSGSLR